MPSYWVPTFLKDMGAWLRDPSIYMYGRWDNPPSKNEGGVDLTSPPGTPVYALADGQVMGAGNFWHPNGNPGYGVITTRVQVPGYGTQDLYYQHIKLNPSIAPCNLYGGQLYGNLKTGGCTQYVHRGDLLGYVEPGVGEVEMGFNANWGGAWGTNHPGAWANDPRPMLKALMAEGPPANLGGQPTLNGASLDTSSSSPSSTSNYIPQLQGEAIKVGIFLLALVLVGFGFYLLFTKQVNGLAKTTAKTAIKAAML